MTNKHYTNLDGVLEHIADALGVSESDAYGVLNREDYQGKLSVQRNGVNNYTVTRLD